MRDACGSRGPRARVSDDASGVGGREAASLARELELRGALVERDGEVVTSVWRVSDADHPHLWDERDFPELRFFLRAWAGANAARQLVVLDERPIAC